MTAPGIAARALALSLCLTSCALSPVGSSMSADEEIEEGKKAVAGIRAEVGLVQDEALTEYVRSIGNTLAKHSPRQDIEYSFYVIDREDVNAFAVPGGHIFITRGLLALADSEDELANVIGHEIGHVAARHYADRSWRKSGGSLLATLGGIAGSFIGLGELASRPGRGLIEGHNRDQEREADDLGQKMAAESGWQPRAMTEFLQKLERDVIIALGAKPDESILDSHPATGERISDAEKRAGGLTVASPRDGTRDAYLTRLQGLTIGQDPRGGVFKGELFLHPDLNLRVKFPEEWITLNRPAFVAAVDPPVQIRVEFASEKKGAKISDLKRTAGAFVRAQSAEAEEEELEDEPEEPTEAASKTPPKKDEPAAGSAEAGKGDADAKGSAPADAKADEGDADAAKKQAKPEFPDFKMTKGGVRKLGKKRTGYAIDGRFLGGDGTARVYFLTVGDTIFRVTCAMPTPLVARYMDDCDRTASSMRKLREGDRDKIEWVQLEVDTAQEGETLRKFNQRTGNRWTESQTAAANGLKSPYTLTPGQRLKVAKARPYDAAKPSEPAPAAKDAAKPQQPPARDRELTIDDPEEDDEGDAAPSADEPDKD